MNHVAFIKTAGSIDYSSIKTIRLGMAEMGIKGLSEQWFLRFGGDAHWSLIAQAFGQERAVFKDHDGRDVYAAFCATKLEFAPYTNLLAEDVEIISSLYHVGSCQIGSVHQIFYQDEPIARLDMISSFVSHQDGRSNQQIVRNKQMPSLNLPHAPDRLIQLAKDSRLVARRTPKHPLEERELGEFIWEAKPCPTLDFNAVGLLYFPAFSKFTEAAHWDWGAARGELEAARALLKSRTIIYLGNIDVGQKLLFFKSGQTTSIKRCDGIYIAQVQTETHLV